MGCPTCEGRTGPETILESLCQEHFDALEGPSSEAMRAAMARGREDYERARRFNSGRTIRLGGNYYKQKKGGGGGK